MVLSSPSLLSENDYDDQQLFDPLRKKWVKATPEERVRQNLLKKLINELFFPFNWIAVEKELSELPHTLLMSKKGLPKRRVDILCFSKTEAGFLPLLMIECKSIALTPKVLRQVIGYNQFVGAKYLAVANQHRILTGQFDEEAGYFRFKEGLPSFRELSL